jgi:hypothetical protein
MKKFLFGLFSAVWGTVLLAQCPFNPTITPSSLQLCPNQSDTLWTQTATVYQWYRSGNPIPNSNLPYLVVNQSTDAGQSFVVAATINGCTEASPAVNVSAYVPPAIALSVGQNLPLTGCEGDERQLILNDPYNLNIRWFRNGVQLNGQTNDTLTLNQSGVYNAVAYIDQCPAYSQTSSTITFSFTASQLPTIQFNSSSLVLSTNASAASYQWYINGVAVQGANQSSFLPQANGTVEVEAIFSASCARFSAPYSYTSYVQNCAHDPLVTPTDLVLCPNSSDTLFTQVADSYQWYREGEAIAGATSNFLLVDAFSAAGAQYSVEATVNGCTEMSPSVLVDGWIFLPIYVISEYPNGETLCEGDTVLLSVGSPFSNAITWFKSGVPISGEEGTSFTVTESGTYSVTASTGICPNYSETSLPIDISFGAAPIPAITYFPVSNSLGTNVNAVSYNWNLNGTPISGATTQVYSIGEAGTYTLSCTYSNGCSATSLPYVYDPTGIVDLNSTALRISPNPANEYVQLQLVEAGNLTVYDVSGKRLKNQSLSKGIAFIDLADFSEGVYFLKLQTANGLYTNKLLITH